MLTSTFHFRAKVFPFVLFLFLCWPFAIKHFMHPNFQSIYKETIFLWTVPSFVFLAFWYFSYHYFLQIQFTQATLTFKRFYGLGKSNSTPIQSIDFYKIDIKKEKRNPTYEILTLYSKNKKIVSINQFYISNYLAFRKIIVDQILIEDFGFTFNLNGFTYQDKKENTLINWNDILRIETYKTDQITSDTIVLTISTSNSTLTITDDSLHWEQFTYQLENHFTTIEKDWKSKVMKPAFESNHVVLFQKIQ